MVSLVHGRLLPTPHAAPRKKMQVKPVPEGNPCVKLSLYAAEAPLQAPQPRHFFLSHYARNSENGQTTVSRVPDFSFTFSGISMGCYRILTKYEKDTKSPIPGWARKYGKNTVFFFFQENANRLANWPFSFFGLQEQIPTRRS